MLENFTTDNESWMYGHDIETKAQSYQGKRPEKPEAKKARQVRLNVNIFLTVFLDCSDVVQHEFLLQSRTANQQYYLEVMCRLRKAIH